MITDSIFLCLQSLLGLGTSFLLLLLKHILFPPPSHWLCKEAHLLLFIMPFMSAVFCCTFSFLGYLPVFVCTKRSWTEPVKHWANYCPFLGTQPAVQPRNMDHCIILRNVTHSFSRTEEIVITMSKCFSRHQNILKSFSWLTFPSFCHKE